ncbi:MAG TPA: sigma 54-interacting transcriptional regulator [Candidatus Deferrimicrobium sp.]|nr:sigma 54-interacting transcriptional regulator [Candidatus Deferrimicrobium sp.]
MSKAVSYPTEVIQDEDFYTIDDILGDSDAMRDLRKQAKHVALGKSTILIRGESGTGKELLARGIHKLSPMGRGPFVAINCSAIPEDLLESELFGYEEGAFTGARKGGKIGKFELAHKGTLFLDEIGDMSLFLQTKLLRVLQEREVERIGGLATIPVDVRILAATHRDLEGMLELGEFREDLFYRINVIPLHITPLRERKLDLDKLSEHFIQNYSRQLNKGGVRVSEGFRDRMFAYSWPGNVRELQNVIEYAITVAEGNVLEEEHLPAKIRKCAPVAKNYSYNLEAIERETICRCIQEFGVTVEGKENAAKALGIGIATLYRKLAQYGLK